MPKGPDPRLDPAPRERVPHLVREGAAHYAEGRFWHAHESWEEAWHGLRAHGGDDAATFVRGMILATAAFENARRGKEAGFKRQMAEALHAMLGREGAGAALGLRDAPAWTRALVAIYVDACRRRVFAHWNGSGWQAPALAVED